MAHLQQLLPALFFCFVNARGTDELMQVCFYFGSCVALEAQQRSLKRADAPIAVAVDAFAAYFA
ncbi:hypothetical protein BH23GEM5_BH23GEM5_06620 [soil metagenome]